MRRTLLALLLVCGFGLPLAMVSTAHAEDEVAAPIVVTVHLALCPIEAVESDLGFYDACHANGIAGATLTFAGDEIDPLTFVTDESGIGAVEVPDGLTSVSFVTLEADASVTGATESYAYCADQISGAVIVNGPIPAGGAVPLFTVDNSQEIICDWYVYTDELPAG